MKRRILSIVLAISLAFGLLSAMSVNVSAYSAHTRDEALNWVRNLANNCTPLDMDGNGYWCVDLILAYYSYLGVPWSSGDASDYRLNKLPDGWNRYQGAQPQPGDILVYTGGIYDAKQDKYLGHVAIYEADRITYHQNIDGCRYVKKVNYLYNGLTDTPYWGVIRPDFSTHTHSYSASVVKQPTCSQTGTRKYTCSCGSSYTETIAATGHKYASNTVPMTTYRRGYTNHVCTACGDSYQDNYIDIPTLNSDGWYHGKAIPADVSTNSYDIQYKNYYERIQKSSPGDNWTYAGVAKSEWQNTGTTYTSPYDLPTSDSRILVSSSYYHFCGPNAGNVGNYEMSGNFVHYDGVPANTVTAQYLGDDNGHPYYYIYRNGERLYCSSGVTCDGSYGTHGNRCCAWYKENVYQDRVKVELYKYTKSSGWGSVKDSSAQSIEVRYKLKSNSNLEYGDANGDGNIDMRDVLLIRKHIAKQPIELSLDASDVTVDGAVDMRDVLLIRKYIAKHPVTLGPKG